MIKREYQRLFDLVRYSRSYLHKEKLITDEEYSELVTERGSVERLEKYDRLIDDNKKLQVRVTELEKALNILSKDVERLLPFCDDMGARGIAISAIQKVRETEKLNEIKKSILPGQASPL